MADEDGRSVVRSLQRGLQLLNCVAGGGPANAKQLARDSSIPLATAYHLLRTLAHEDYVLRLDDGSYILGPRLRTAVERPHFATASAVS